jgi:hypothetical protein
MDINWKSQSKTEKLTSKKSSKIHTLEAPIKVKDLQSKRKIMENYQKNYEFKNIYEKYNKLLSKRKIAKSIEVKGSSHKLSLPAIKDPIQLSNLNDNNNNSGSSKSNLKNNSLFYIKGSNYRTINPRITYEINNSTIAPSLNLNSSSKQSNKFNKNRYHISISAIYDNFKNIYLASLKHYRSKIKEAEEDYKEQLNLLRQEKIKKSKDEELFKKYELGFNREKHQEDMRKKYKFFQEVNLSDNLTKIFHKILENIKRKAKPKKEHVIKLKKIEINSNRRIINSMKRKDKVYEDKFENFLKEYQI